MARVPLRSPAPSDARDRPGQPGDDHAYTYDSNGRLTRHRATIDSTNYDVNYTYDTSGRLDTLQYPGSARYSSGLTVRYGYTDEGHLEDVRNTAGNALFWEIDGVGADGQLTGETFGNDVSLDRHRCRGSPSNSTPAAIGRLLARINSELPARYKDSGEAVAFR